jgi:hypothetical protein
MTTETLQKPRCPTCGAQILRPHLSLCSYCGTPLGLVGAAAAEPSAALQRLAKMRTEAEYAAAMASPAPEGEEERQARKMRSRAGALAGLALMFLVLGFSSEGASRRLGSAPPWLTLPNMAAALFALASARAAIRARNLSARVAGLPVMRRAALVTSRRSETGFERGRARTVYFFTLELEDGSAGEFRWPGMGTAYEPLVTGNTGVAFTRRDQLLGFRAIRV